MLQRYCAGSQCTLPVLSLTHSMTERPCRNCALANRPCTYAVRDRKVTVPESYLRSLECGVHNPRAIDNTANRPLLDSNPASEQRTTSNAALAGPRLSYDPVVENSTAELFVSKLKQIQGSNSSPGVLGTCSDSLSPQIGEQGFTKPSKYEYFALSYDTSRMSQTVCTRYRHLRFTQIRNAPLNCHRIRMRSFSWINLPYTSVRIGIGSAFEHFTNA